MSQGRDDGVLLTTKRHQLENLVNTRPTKLSSLWKITYAFTEPKSQYQDASTTTTGYPPQLSLDVFLARNDLTKERRFDPKLLSQICNATKRDIVGLTNGDAGEEGTIGLPKATDEVPRANGDRDTGAVATSKDHGRNTIPTTTGPVSDQALPSQDNQTISTSLSNAPSQNAAPNDTTRATTASTTDPTAQLLSEVARSDALVDNSTVAGVKRDHETAIGKPDDALAKRRKDEIRPPMRIDTNVQPKRPSIPGPLESPAPSATPSRMNTRISSGALRQRSVSEITGETPKISHARSESRDVSSQTPRTAVAATPNSAMFQSKIQELRDRDREKSKMSTVVFTRPSATAPKQPDNRPEEVRRRERLIAEKDYLVPLFYAQASAQTPKLTQLVVSSKKTLSTNDHKLDYREDADCRILKRIYHLQNNNRWALRQLERAKEPDRPMSHWDAVLAEAKWMRTDFREERRWKIVIAKKTADACAEYVNATETERKRLRIRIRKARRASVANQATPMSLPSGNIPSETTPDLEHSAEDELSEPNDDDLLDIDATVAPAALFSLPPSDVIFDIQHTPTADKMLEELPLCPIWSAIDDPNKPYSVVLDSRWKTPIAPITKFATGKLLLKTPEPRTRRSKYDYEEDDDTDSTTAQTSQKALLPREQNDVALFQSENQHIVQRLHAAHAFRPPSEFAMPAQGFFEARTSSQWTPNEDIQLKKLVQEYEYNWSLISSSLATPSLFTSSAQRRTPWECFERWASFEGLPGDMSKHQYFRAWNSRRDAAREHIEAANQAQQQDPSTAHIPLKRKSSEPASVERTRQIRYFNQFRIMVAIKVKKEKAASKPATAPPKKTPAETEVRAGKMTKPSEFSAHKYKQEVEFREQRMRYQRHMVEQQRAAAAAKFVQQNAATQSGAALPSQPGRTAQMNGTVLPNGNAPRPMPGVAVPFPNGQVNLRNGMTPQQAQQLMALQQAQQQQQARIASQTDPSRGMAEAARLAAEQQRLAQQRQHQFPNVNMAQFPTGTLFPSTQANGQSSPATNGTARLSSSPGSIKGLPTQSLADGAVLLNQYQNVYRRSNPNATAQEALVWATARLNQQVQNSRASSMNGMVNGNSMGQANMAAQPMQTYQNMLRQQQLLQQQRNGSAGRSGSPGSRPGSQNGAMMQRQSSSLSATNQSPRPTSAHINGPS